MEETEQIILGGEGVLQFARDKEVDLKPEIYFITDHQYEEYQDKRKKLSKRKIDELHGHGTIGAVALDKHGNLAAGTSTGGTVFRRKGRISDSSIIGAGCFADTQTCGVSGTGDGEYLIKSAAANSVSKLMEYTNCTVQEAVDHVVHVQNKGIKGDMGLIAIDSEGNFGTAFNSELMFRARRSSEKPLEVKVYKD